MARFVTALVGGTDTPGDLAAVEAPSPGPTPIGPDGPDQSGGTAADNRPVHSALLAGVEAGVAGFDDLDAFLRRAMTAIHATLGYETANLFLVPQGFVPSESEPPDLRVVAGAGDLSVLDAGGDYRQAWGLGLVGLAARSGRVVVANNVRLDTAYFQRPGTETIRAELCVPLVRDDIVLGVLNVESTREDAFSDRDVQTLTTMADHLAAAVNSWRGHREQEARAAEVARLTTFNERIVQGVREGLVATEADGTITFANSSFETMLGYPPGNLVGRRWQALVPAGWRSRLGLLTDGEGRYETRLLTRDGDELAVQVSLEPRHDLDGSAGHLAVFTDITERVRAEFLSRALGDAGLALQSADDRDEVFATLQAQAERTGLRVIVSLFDESLERVAVRFASLDPAGVRVVERTFGIRIADLEIPLGLAPPIQELVAKGRPTFAARGADLIGPLLPPDARHLDEAIARRLGMGPSMHVPMFVSGQPIGVVTVSHRELAAPDTSAATVFANQVATALDRARLADETEDRQRKLGVLSDAAQHLAASASLDRLADGITEQLLRVFDSDAAGLYVYHEERGQLELAAAPGFTDEERRVAEASAWARHPGWVIRNRQPLLSGDANHDPRVVYIGSRPRFNSVIYTPLTVEEHRCIGALAVASRRGYAYKPSDLRLLATLADQVAVAVANALQVRDARGRAEQLERVSVAGRRITANLNVPDLLHQSASEAARVFDVSHASVFLLDPSGRVELAAHSPRHVAMIDPTSGDLEWLAQYDRPVAIPDIRDTTALRGLKIHLIEQGVHSVLIAPIHMKDQFIGGMLLYATEGRRAFGGPSQDLAAIVASQIGVAVENARLYQATDDAKQRVEAVVQSSFTAIITVDSVGRVREANPSAVTLLGIDAEEMESRLLDDVLGIDLWLDPDGPIGVARRTRRMVEPVERILPSAGDRDEREVLLGVAPLPDGYLVSMADITRLKELDRLKSELVANVSHELRSPLASIKAYTELLLDGLVPDPQTYEEFLTVIDTQADRLGQCIGNILDLTRVESEGYQARLENFSLGAFIEEVVDAVGVRAEHQHVKVDVRGPVADAKLLGDRPILFSLLKNLLDNAVKYSPVGGTVTVDVAVSPAGLEIALADHGPGIPQSELPRIFEKFYRVPSSNPSGIEGSGLGLVIARQAARAHGGDIRVVSGLGSGSTFTVHLPPSIFETIPAVTALSAPVKGSNGGHNVERTDAASAHR